MPKLKTHKGIKKRFKVSANGKVSHKRCGSSHLMSHKNGKQVRRLRKKSVLKISAEAHRLRLAVHQQVGSQPRGRHRGGQAGCPGRCEGRRRPRRILPERPLGRGVSVARRLAVAKNDEGWS